MRWTTVKYAHEHGYVALLYHVAAVGADCGIDRWHRMYVVRSSVCAYASVAGRDGGMSGCPRTVH